MKFDVLEVAFLAPSPAGVWVGGAPGVVEGVGMVQSVERFWFWLIAVIIEGSEFSGVIGVKPLNEPCHRLNEKRLLNARFRIISKPANALPITRSLTLLSKRCAQAYLSGLVLLPPPVNLPDAKLPPMS